jgi:hypothetical protein
VNALVAHDVYPGRSSLFADFQKARAMNDEEIILTLKGLERNASGIGTPDDIRHHIQGFQDSGVDQVIFLQQAGFNKHAHIREALELFAKEVMPEFKAVVAEREAKKAKELAPYRSGYGAEEMDGAIGGRRDPRRKGLRGTDRAGALATPQTRL